jgi:hypothetical protein
MTRYRRLSATLMFLTGTALVGVAVASSPVLAQNSTPTAGPSTPTAGPSTPTAGPSTPMAGPPTPASTPTGDYNPSPGPSSATATRVVAVTNVTDLLNAINAAQPGDAITLEDGTYLLNSNVEISRPGTDSQRIFVRARNKGLAQIQHCNTEGFKVTAPYWIFEDLQIRGVCPDDGISNADAFHVTGGADHLIIRNSTIVDFQSHVKLNQETPGGVQTWPNSFWAINNIWRDTKPMTGSDPKNVLNIDGGLNHVIRGNIFVDIATANFSQDQSAIYPKAGVQNGIIEQNLVVCTKTVTSGASLRGIFTGDAGGFGGICNGSCTDQNMTYRNNIVMHCQGDGNSGGIFINQESNAQFLHNTVHDVKWNFYYPDVPGPNYFTASLMFRDWVLGGAATPTDTMDLQPDTAGMNAIFTNPDIADFSLKDGTSILGKVPRNPRALYDFCGHLRATTTDIGAIDYSHPKAAECVQYIKFLYQSL